MKNLLARWVMALMLVLFSGSGVVALQDPYLDGIMDPTGTVVDGSEDDDHPWGGDQSPAVPDGVSTTRPSRVIVTTGILPLDQLLNALVCTGIMEYREPEQVRTVSSTSVSKQDAAVYTKDVKPRCTFSRKKGVSR